MKSDEEQSSIINTNNNNTDEMNSNTSATTTTTIKSTLPFSPPTNSTESTSPPPPTLIATENNNTTLNVDEEKLKDEIENNINGHKDENIDKIEANGINKEDNEVKEDKEVKENKEIKDEDKNSNKDEVENDHSMIDKESISGSTNGSTTEDSKKDDGDKMEIDEPPSNNIIKIGNNNNNNIDKEKETEVKPDLTVNTEDNNKDNKDSKDIELKRKEQEKESDKGEDPKGDDGVVDNKQIEEELANSRKENSLSPSILSNGDTSPPKTNGNGTTTTTTTTTSSSGSINNQQHDEDEEMEDSEYELLKDKNIIENNLVAKSSYNSNREEDIEQKKRLECLGNIEKIEKEFNVLKERFFKEKLEQIKKEVDDIKIGEHQTLQERLRDLEIKKEKKMQIAETWKNYQLQSIMNMFDSEKQQFEDEHLEETTHLKDRMVNSLQDKQKRITEERDSMRSDSESRINTRTRRRTTQNNPLLQQQSNSKKKQTPAQISYSLKENEIQEDFNIIFNNSVGVLKSRR